MFEIVIPRKAFCFSADLLLPSRIEAEMRAAGVPYRRIGGPDLEQARREGGILFLDLGVGVDEARNLIQQFRAPDAPAWRICVFGSHLDHAGLQSMREAGADRVVSRSFFTANLQSIINELVMGSS